MERRAAVRNTLLAAAMTAWLVLPVATPAGAGAELADGNRGGADASAFDPGLLISDDSFFNSLAMTEDEIQRFLASRWCVPEQGVPCLADYVVATASQVAGGERGDGDGDGAIGRHCLPYAGGAAEPASRIFAKVAQACGISPQVLIVLVQKEQSLVSRPTADGYLRATGYGCPDTADCDGDFFGFFNQVYAAAWQFRQYSQFPARAFEIGRVAVPYSPDEECGASVVNIHNQATANLYNYTPYQPNGVALRRLYGTGDECSSYGNRNFWRIYSDWFGDPTSERFPGWLGDCFNLVGGQPCRPTFPFE